MSIIVQKFGGSSLTSIEKREQAIGHIIRAKIEGKKVVVVVSAMGRMGDPYATDTLLSLFHYKGKNSPEKREKDLLVHCGEIISATVMANMLTQSGHQAIVLTGYQAGIQTTQEYNDAQIIDINTERIRKELFDDKIVIITGFQGVSKQGEITTLGRGGSDTTATAIGAALDADYCDIYTDVDGVMTADPRIVADAKKLNTITYHEICNLAYQGAKVIHPRAVEAAMQKKIPIRIRSTFNNGPGTIITDQKVQDINNNQKQLITSITQLDKITQIKIHADEGQYDLQMKVFRAMADNDISVDFINVNMNGVAYTVADGVTDLATNVLSTLGLKPKIERNCAKISCIGAAMTGVPGVMAKIIETLTYNNIKILQSADSHTTIWVLVKENDMAKGVKALHKAFNL
ncbi:aspartate kinase [Desulfuribacillus alkaliarsenatis]|uniref:Aspartokinase n=1 Tax=Desulfuribacillus alkaliarsenatis TaxID=766136 RepID=A0A1E5G652_9FIRM|nr:aspartate kinase [Desulfuribacillus alkaliarsenatis]OEF98660.1 aspartate kinase [Desulfuribacillus alkaliarsenatis]